MIERSARIGREIRGTDSAPEAETSGTNVFGTSQNIVPLRKESGGTRSEAFRAFRAFVDEEERAVSNAR